MFCRRITKLGSNLRSPFEMIVVSSHTPSCPARASGGGASSAERLQRAQSTGKCRFGLIPEEWFTFFHVKTGVTGPYIFGLCVANYCVSKEILVMEHEYYGGLSWIVVIYLISTKFGKTIGASLDKGVDAIANQLEQGRKDEIAYFDNVVKSCQRGIEMAEGQKLLMDAKKENVAMQLEAIYRDRIMLVYRTVKGRMDYHVKRYNAAARIQQKWMIKWILQHVEQAASTSQFQDRAMQQAIADLEGITGRV